MNFNESPSSVPVPQEFLAVVLAGFGNDLLPLTSDYGDTPCPKALLPVANKPIISYTLDWLEASGLKNVLLICPASHRAALWHHIHSDPSPGSSSSLHIDIQTYDESQELSVGTCSVLKHFANRIPGDFVLLPCDFLPPPSLRLSTVLDKFRIESKSDGAILTSLWFEHKSPEKEKSAVEDAWPAMLSPVPVIYDEKSGTLLHVDTPDDTDRNGEEIELRMAVLSKYPRTRFTVNLLDSHVYVCKRTVLDVLAQKPHFDSIREEFVPWLCKIHSQRTKREKYGGTLSPINVSPTQSLGLQHSTLHLTTPKASRSAFPPFHTGAYQSHNASRMSIHTDFSSTAPPSPTLPTSAIREEESLRCGIVIHRLADGYAARANNIWSYMELNRAALSDLSVTSHDPALVDPKSSVSADSLIGESTKIGERSSVKRSVIGRHCVIGKNVKIIGSVLMDHCVIEDGAKLERCLIGNNVHVGSKSELLRCIAQAGFEVEAGGIYKHEKLDVSDWAAAPPIDDDESDDESEDEDSD